MGGAFSSAGVPLSLGVPLSCRFRSSSDALLMACCCFFMRSGTFGSGVELASAGGPFEHEQIIPSKPAANRVIKVFFMSIWGRNFEAEWGGLSSLATAGNDIAPERLSTNRKNEKRATWKCRAFSV